MEIRPHFSELLKLLEDKNVEYVIVGGYAMAYHGYPRFTKDIDIFYRNTSENIKRIRTALIGFGFNENDLPESIFSGLGRIKRN
ncbi:MAG: nucleotidyltransferase [Chitinispirillaceae bacterium]|nr:nucleotidyltransferase [Chitinispirillaceae bacterium]